MFRSTLYRSSPARRRRGQSLVEFALTMPVLLTILAGLVEVANILTVYNQVQITAREGVRFGAMGGADDFVFNLVDQASKNSLVVVPDRMRVWVVRPIMDTSVAAWGWRNANAANPWGEDTTGTPLTVDCLYPNPCPAGPDDPVFPLEADDVRDSIRSIGTGATPATVNNTKFVIVVVYYEADLVLNLPWFTREGGRFPMWAHAIMRQEVTELAVAQFSSGCSAYPIALDRAAIPPNVREGDTSPDLTRNVDWSFLSWRHTDLAPAALEGASGSLWAPGNSMSAGLGYVEYNDPADTSLHKGDWVPQSLGSISGPMLTNLNDNTLANANRAHIFRNRVLRIILYDVTDASDPRGANPKADVGLTLYRIDGFALIRIASMTSPDTMSFTWVGTDDSCGNAAAAP